MMIDILEVQVVRLSLGNIDRVELLRVETVACVVRRASSSCLGVVACVCMLVLKFKRWSKGNCCAWPPWKGTVLRRGVRASSLLIFCVVV
jgi:hypothetical protein